jgi:hypothetical protein
MRTAMESLMRPKQTATEAAGRGAVTGSGTGARRRLPRSLYVAFLLFAGFSVSGAGCLVMQDDVALSAAIMEYNSYNQTRSKVEAELASPTPDLTTIGVGLHDMEGYRQSVSEFASAAEKDPEFRLFRADDYNSLVAMKSELNDHQIALTDQFDRLGGWGAATAQHKVLTSGGTWNWVTLGTNPDLNPGGPTFTGKTSPRGGNGCAPGQTFIIGVGCV